MQKIQVIGASGFIGDRLVKSLLASGNAVRCLTRDQARVKDLAAAGCESIQGDISDKMALLRVVNGVACVYIATHIVSEQKVDGPDRRFMDIEKSGLLHVITACQNPGVKRVIYLTLLGTDAREASKWLRERGHVVELLLASGLVSRCL